MKNDEELRKKIEEIIDVHNDYVVVGHGLHNLVTVNALLNLFHQEQTKLIEEFEKIIGEEEKQVDQRNYPWRWASINASNWLRTDLHHKLEDLKKTQLADK